MRILWVKNELLHPVDKGGKIRTYSMLRELRKRHHITYVTLDDGSAPSDAAAAAEREYCNRLERVPFNPPPRKSPAFFAALGLNMFSALPYGVSRYRSEALRAAIRRVVVEDRIDLVICDFLAPSLNVPSDLGVPCVLFQHNVEASIWERHVNVARNPVVRWYFGVQYRRMWAWERAECRRFDGVIAVSDADAAAYVREYGLQASYPVPTGVDVDYFTPSGQEGRKPNEILFVGSMDWMPNEDGILWFAEEVLPRVHALVPEAHLTVVGRKPPARVLELAAQSPLITVTGTVPDVRPFFERAGVVVVPLRIGGGTRLKIYEGMSMGRATVSTTIGAEGLPVRDGEDIVLADAPADMAGAIAALLTDPARAQRIGDAAAVRVREEFSWSAATEVFARHCETIVSKRRGPSPLSAIA